MNYKNKAYSSNHKDKRKDHEGYSYHRLQELKQDALIQLWLKNRAKNHNI